MKYTSIQQIILFLTELHVKKINNIVMITWEKKVHIHSTNSILSINSIESIAFKFIWYPLAF